jgi:hypothetical protein
VSNSESGCSSTVGSFTTAVFNKKGNTYEKKKDISNDQKTGHQVQFVFTVNAI